MKMDRISRHRQNFRHDGNADEYSTIISSETTNPSNNLIGNSHSRGWATSSRANSIRRNAVVAGHCIINSLIVVLIVAVAITFLGSICIGLILLLKPLPSALQERTFVALPSDAVFHEDDNSFSLQYASNRNGSIHTDDDVFIMERNFPTPQPTRLPTSVWPTKVPSHSRLTKAPATFATPTFTTNQISIQNRDSENATQTKATLTNASNLMLDSNLKNNTATKVGFTFNDDGKSINNDDPFGNNIPEGSVDDIVAAAKQPSTSNDVINSNSPCTGANCNKSFLDDVLQNALVTQNIDDTVKGNDDHSASNTDDSMKDVNPRKWTKQANFSQDDAISNDGPNGNDFWNDVADDNHLKSDTAGNIASYITFSTADELQDDVLINYRINPSTKVDDSMKNSGNDDLKGINDDKGTFLTFQEENISNNIVKNNPNKNFAPGKNGDAKTDDFQNDNFVSNKEENTSNNNGVGDAKTDDYQNDNFASNNDKQLEAEGDYLESHKYGKLNHGTANINEPTATVGGSADDDFKNDNFVSNSNDVLAELDDNKNSKLGEESETSTQSIDPSIALDTADDFKNDNFVSSSKEQSNRVGDSHTSITSANFVGGTNTEVNHNNFNANAGGENDDFQDDDFKSMNDNLTTKVDDLQWENKDTQFVTGSGGAVKNFENSVDEHKSNLDDFATGDDTYEATLSNPGMQNEFVINQVLDYRVTITSAPSTHGLKKANKGAKGGAITLTGTPSSQGYRITSNPSAEKKKLPKRSAELPTRQPGSLSSRAHVTAYPSSRKG